MTKVKLGFLFPVSGIATGYTALLLAYAIWHFVPSGTGVNMAISFLVLYWSVVQFSSYGIEWHSDKKSIRLSRKLWSLIEIGKYIEVSDIEFYYVRMANLTQTMRHGTLGRGMMYEEIDITDKSGLVEIKLKGQRKYQIIANGKMVKMKEIQDEIFVPTGIEHHKAVGKKPKNRRR